MNTLALALIALSNFFLAIIIGLLCFFIYRHMRNNKNSNSEAVKFDYHPEIAERIKDLKQLKPHNSDLFCPNHPSEPGEVTCSICDDLFCHSCIRPYKSMHLCKEHFPLMMRHNWSEVFTLKTSGHEAEEGVKLYELKKKILENQKLPSYIETHYKINVDQDIIETYLVMFCIEEQSINFQRALEDFEALK
jgi:hypothetical protein